MKYNQVSKKSVISQLKERRVIRATLIYVALFWVGLQVANILEEAEFISDRLVRGFIALGVTGIPVTVLASWFLETPWKQRKWISVAGDVFIIVAITLAAALFAWQQWFTSFTRPTVAVLKIEATDTRTDTGDLATHLAVRLRTALATRTELRVLELRSSQHDDLSGLAVADKAEPLNADYLLAGTVAQSGSVVRLNLQLYTASGELLHGETFEDRLLDQAQLQNRALAEFWEYLPLSQEALNNTRRIVAECKYPDDRQALLAIAAVDTGKPLDLEPWLRSHEDAGMLHLANSRRLFANVAAAEPVRKPVLQQVAMQSLANTEQHCPGLPDSRLLRLINTNETVTDDMLRQNPNAATLFHRASQQNSEPRRANAFRDEAILLDPLADW